MAIAAIGKTRSFGALAAATAGLAVMPAHATSRDRSWIGVERVAVLTRLTQDIASSPITAQSLCEQARAIIGEGAPVPVDCVFSVSDGALQAPRTATLILDASLAAGSEAERLLLFTVRRDREGGLEPAPIYFGAAPRAVPVSGSAADDAAVEGALRASFSEILPWLRPAGSGELSPKSGRER